MKILTVTITVELPEDLRAEIPPRPVVAPAPPPVREAVAPAPPPVREAVTPAPPPVRGAFAPVAPAPAPTPVREAAAGAAADTTRSNRGRPRSLAPPAPVAPPAPPDIADVDIAAAVLDPDGVMESVRNLLADWQ